MPSEIFITKHHFRDSQVLAHALSNQLLENLQKGIATRGRAVLAVSGGSTPKHLFAQLAKAALDWSKVYVTLVDERWVPENNERSNARLVKTLLLQNAAAAAHFISLYQPGADTPETGLAALRKRLDEQLPSPFDAVVLGMGDDGHTASFFPGADRLTEALDLQGHERVLPINAKGAGEARITFTLPALLNTEALYLHIEGKAKDDLLTAVEQSTDTPRKFPVRALLDQQQKLLNVYWCP